MSEDEMINDMDQLKALVGEHGYSVFDHEFNLRYAGDSVDEAMGYFALATVQYGLENDVPRDGLNVKTVSTDGVSVDMFGKKSVTNVIDDKVVAVLVGIDSVEFSEIMKKTMAGRVTDGPETVN